MRHKNSIILPIIIFIVFFMSFHAMAQNTPNYITIKAGAYTPTDDLDDAEFDSGFNGEIAFGHYINPNLAVEGGLGYFQTDASFSIENDEIKVVPVTVTAKGIIPAQNAEFFAGAGIGVYLARIESDFSGFTSSISDNDVVFGFHLLIGANVNIAPNVFLGIEAKPFWTGDAQFEGTIFGFPATFETNLNGYTVTGNLGFRF